PRRPHAGGVLREQRLLLRTADAAGTPRRRAAGPRALRGLRARARARVLGDVADRPDRTPADRLDHLAAAARYPPRLDRGAARRSGCPSVAGLERAPPLRLARPAVVRRPLVVLASPTRLRLALAADDHRPAHAVHADA